MSEIFHTDTDGEINQYLKNLKQVLGLLLLSHPLN